MRTRSVWVIPTALLAGATLALPLTTLTAQAASPGTATAAAVRTRVTPSAQLVTLPTGDLVRLIKMGGATKVTVRPSAAGGPGRAIVTHRMKSDLYVMPADVEPYLGRFLDPTLFDVTTLATEVKSDGRLPVRISYRGSAPTVAGVTITSATAGVATGYFTPTSSAAFGRALTTQWKTDTKADWPARTSLFSGVTKITVDAPVKVAAKPDYPMFTLNLKVTGSNGKPIKFGVVGLMNVDDADKYLPTFSNVIDGVARVSVPKGHYVAYSEETATNSAETKFTYRFTTVNTYEVTGAGQTLTIDNRKATLRPVASVPKKASVLLQSFQWERGDATSNASALDGYLLDAADTLLVAPAGRPTVGTVSVEQSWTLAGPGETPAYTYDLATAADQIPANPVSTFTPADLATVNANYYGEDGPGVGSFSRTAILSANEDDVLVGGSTEIPRGSRRTEYLGSLGGAVSWEEDAALNENAVDDSGFLENSRIAKPGSVQRADWFRGPLAAAIPLQTSATEASLAGASCYACRTSKKIELQLAPFTDSSQTHAGYINEAPDGLPVARFRFYANGKLVSDHNDDFGATVTASTAKTTYKAIFDVDRRLQEPNQSTKTETTLTFDSAAKGGGKLPDNWSCDLDTPCQVLPILQARVALPTSLNGTLPVGKSTITVTTARIQHATASAVASATLQFRVPGEDWTSVKLTSIGGGKYTGTIDNTSDTAGANIDLRLSAGDQGGSTFQQTVLRAYTVAGHL